MCAALLNSTNRDDPPRAMRAADVRDDAVDKRQTHTRSRVTNRREERAQRKVTIQRSRHRRRVVALAKVQRRPACLRARSDPFQARHLFASTKQSHNQSSSQLHIVVVLVQQVNECTCQAPIAAYRALIVTFRKYALHEAQTFAFRKQPVEGGHREAVNK